MMQERRLSISEASRMVGLPIHILRQWEERFPQIRPRRTRSNRRFYLKADIDVILRVKEMVREQGITFAGAQKLLVTEKNTPSPVIKNREDALALLDGIQTELRAMLALIDQLP